MNTFESDDSLRDLLVGGQPPKGDFEDQRLEASVVSHMLGSPNPVEVGRFRIEKRIGAGSMGIVYAAWDPVLHRRVALKVLHLVDEPGAQARATERLEREARAMAGLDHPNVVTIFDVGAVGKQFFLAMEFVGGGTLRERLGKPMDLAQVLVLFLPAGRALAAAHRVGVVHRDFKPENVFIGEQGRVRVGDFGLVLTPDEVQGQDPSASVDGAGVVGTLGYMAPEQVEGRLVTAAADQFSFCVALFEALFGVLPPSSPALEDIPVLRPGPHQELVPQCIRRLLGRGLSLKPSHRFGTMDDLTADLEQGVARAGAARRANPESALAAADPRPPGPARPAREATEPALARAPSILVPVAPLHGFCEPDWDEPLDEAERMAAIPPDRMARGVTFEGLMRAVVERTGARLPDARPRYFPFANYPVREYLQLVGKAARAAHPNKPPRKALALFGRYTHDAVLNSCFGKVILALAGSRYADRLRMINRLYSGLCQGQLTTIVHGPNLIEVQLRGLWVYPESFHQGVLAANMARDGLEGVIHVRRSAMDEVDLLSEWR